MSKQPLPNIARYGFIFSGVCTIVVASILISAQWRNEKRNMANIQCQDDLKVEIAQLQDYVNAKKAAQAAEHVVFFGKELLYKAENVEAERAPTACLPAAKNTKSKS